MSVKTTFEIGENIKRLREFRGYSQEYMATELNVSQRTYGNIESDKGKVNKEQIDHIARVLEIDPVFLLTYDDKVVFKNEQCEQVGMFNTYNAVSKVERELFEKRIEELKEEITFLRSLIKQQYDEK